MTKTRKPAPEPDTAPAAEAPVPPSGGVWTVGPDGALRRQAADDPNPQPLDKDPLQ